MQCPRCQNLENKVIDSRLTDKNSSIRRRRECEKCGARFTTIEKIRIENLIVVKKNGTRDAYDRQKLERGIWHACGKRPVTKEQVDQLISELEETWSQKNEVSSKQIGEAVMDKLKLLDKVAYIRFASVYRDFEDLGSFHQEIEILEGSEGAKGSEEEESARM